MMHFSLQRVYAATMLRTVYVCIYLLQIAHSHSVSLSYFEYKMILAVQVIIDKTCARESPSHKIFSAQV